MQKIKEKILIFSVSENPEDGALFIKVPFDVGAWKTLSINFIDALSCSGYSVYEIPITKELNDLQEVEKYVTRKLRLKRLPNGVT